MKVRAKVVDGEEANWSKEALEDLVTLLPGTKVSNRVGSKLDVYDRGTEKDQDPVVGEVVASCVIGQEVFATIELNEGEELPGHVVGIGAMVTLDEGRTINVSRVDSMGLDDDPKTSGWGEIIG